MYNDIKNNWYAWYALLYQMRCDVNSQRVRGSKSSTSSALAAGGHSIEVSTVQSLELNIKCEGFFLNTDGVN